MKINRSMIEPKWIDFENDKDVSFKVRQFPMSMGMWMTGSDDEFIDFNWKRFDYSLVDWKGITDEDDNEMECNEDNKKFVFDFIPEISLWVTAALADSADNIVEKKILPNTADGSTDQLDPVVKSVVA